MIATKTSSGKRTGWIKLVDEVDETKSNGYAFSGQFLYKGWNDLSVGSVLVEQYPTGSVKHPGKAGVAYRVSIDGELEVLAEVGDWFSPKFFEFRSAVVKALAGGGVDVDALRAERDRLRGRIEEIDSILNEDLAKTIGSVKSS